MPWGGGLAPLAPSGAATAMEVNTDKIGGSSKTFILKIQVWLITMITDENYKWISYESLGSKTSKKLIIYSKIPSLTYQQLLLSEQRDKAIIHNVT